MSNKPPKYRLHKPTGQALVEVNGRRFYLGKHGTDESQQKYQRIIAEWAQCQLHPTTKTKASEPLGISVNRLILLYYQHALAYYIGPDQRPTSEVNNIKYSLKPLKELYGYTPVSLFGPKCLKAVQARMVSLGWSRKLINSRINHIRRAVKWGVSEELVPPSVLEGLRSVQGLRQGRTQAHETEPVRAVPDEHVDPVLSCVAPQVAAMIQLQRLSGMRPGEVVMMRSCDIDMTGEVWVYSPPKHKTAYHGHRREIHLGPKSQQILKPYIENKSLDAFLFSPKDAEHHRNGVRRQQRRSPRTPSQEARRPKDSPKRSKRDRYDRDSYRRAIDYGIKKASVPHWHPNQLRHSCATAIRKEFGLDAAQVILGHRHADVSQIYAETDRRRAVTIVKQVG